MTPEELISRLATDLPKLNLKGWVDKEHAVVELPAANIPELFKFLKTTPDYDFKMFLDLTAVDWFEIRKPRFDVVYHLLSIEHNHRLRIKAQVEEGEAVPTITKIWEVADWFEREVWDLYGIKFTGHPNLKRILMYDEFKGHPLRKDYPYDKRQPLIAETWPVRKIQVKMKEADVIHRP